MADELTHEFVVRFLRGDFKQASPSRGRFRDFLKRALRNLAIDYWRRQQSERKATSPLAEDVPAVCPFDSPDADEAFLRGWRKELTSLAAQALEQFDSQHDHYHHAILHFRAAHPKKRSEEMAELFAKHIGRPFTAVPFSPNAASGTRKVR